MIDCELTSKSSRLIYENIKDIRNIIEIKFEGISNKIKKGNEIGDAGCKAIFMNSMYLSNLEVLNLQGNLKIIIGNEISHESSKEVRENLKFLKNLKEIDFSSKY